MMETAQIYDRVWPAAYSFAVFHTNSAKQYPSAIVHGVTTDSHVDDIIFASKNEQTKDILAGHLRKKYRITEPAQLTWALGMKISFAADGIILTQDLYMSKILERFGFTSAAKSATTPLAHGTTLTRAMKKTPRRVTSPSSLWVQSSTRSSARPDCHRPRLSTSVDFESLGAAQEGPTIIYTDSTGAEALVDHPTSHRRTKHIEIRREFIKFHIGHETVKIERVSTKDQLADIMTKPLRQDIHNYLVQMILHG
ncbi:RNA-dependent DNA polymerase [Pseudoscourfieldia marina]